MEVKKTESTTIEEKGIRSLNGYFETRPDTHPNVIFQIFQGFLNAIPNMDTLHGIYGYEQYKYTDTTLQIKEPSTITEGAYLAKLKDEDQIFLITNNKRYLIQNMSVINQYQFHGSVKNVPIRILSNLENGPEITTW